MRDSGPTLERAQMRLMLGAYCGVLTGQLAASNAC